MKQGNEVYSSKMSKEELEKKLTEGIYNIMDSQRFKNYLETFGKFHSYSWRNSLLIFTQKPDATLCASFTTWKKLGRWPKKGTALYIWAPNMAKVEYENEQGDKEEHRVLAGFHVTHTFDVSDTEGKELPTLYEPLMDDVESFERVFQALKDFAGIPVSFSDSLGSADGAYYPLKREIKLKAGMGQAKIISTLVHEIAHSILHNNVINCDRNLEECQAESVAYAVCHWLGIECSTQSLSYLAVWSKGRELEEIKSSIVLIHTTACGIIDTIKFALQVKGE